jgi:hypothetical protein
VRLKQAAGGLTGSEALRREGKDAGAPRRRRARARRGRERAARQRERVEEKQEEVERLKGEGPPDATGAGKDPRTRPARATTRIEPTRLEASAGSAPASALSFSGAAAAALP